MKKKIEISIVYVIAYVVAFLIVSGMLFYKSCISPDQVENTTLLIQGESPEKPEPERIIIKETLIDSVILSPTERKIERKAEVIQERLESQQPKGKRLIQIPRARSVFNISSPETANSREGRKYYENDYGILESKIIQNENGFSEILIAKNKQGETINQMEISHVDIDRQISKYATVSRDKIHVYEITTSPKHAEKEETRTEYIIKPDFRFVKGKSYSKLM